MMGILIKNECITLNNKQYILSYESDGSKVIGENGIARISVTINENNSDNCDEYRYVGYLKIDADYNESKNMYFKEPVCAWLSIFLNSDYRNIGIGTKLTEKLLHDLFTDNIMEKAYSLNVNCALLEVLHDNDISSHLADKFGFENMLDNDLFSTYALPRENYLANQLN